MSTFIFKYVHKLQPFYQIILYQHVWTFNFHNERTTRSTPVSGYRLTVVASTLWVATVTAFSYTYCDLGQFRKEGYVLFNDTLNIFYLRLYGVRHMVKDHSDSEKGNPLPPHRLLLSINSKGSFICTIPQTG